MEIDETRPTGLWLLNMLPLGGRKHPRDQGESTATIFDPVALAFSASPKFTNTGWIGLDAMPSSFLYKVLDADRDGGDVDSLIHNWIDSNKERIVAEYEERLNTYTHDELAIRALREALFAYKNENYLSAVRVLMPEFERFGRMIVSEDGSQAKNQKEAIKAIQDYISVLPVGFYPPIESLAAYSLLSEDLFAKCFTETEALALSNPNRHAEMHGLNSYGDLRGATKILSVADFVVSAVNSVVNQSNET